MNIIKLLPAFNPVIERLIILFTDQLFIVERFNSSEML